MENHEKSRHSWVMLERHPVPSYFLITYLFSWLWWITVGFLWPTPPTVLILPGAYGPTIAALLLTARLEGRTGVRMLLQRLTHWRVSPVWYVWTILGPTIVALIAISLHRLLGGTGPSIASIAGRFGLGANQVALLLLYMPFVFLFTVISGGPIAEELGWRGFAQERLQSRLGAGRAGLIIGLLWTVWHLPLFIILPLATGNVPFEWYLPLVTSWGVLFGLVYKRTGGSVLLCILFHAGVNFVLGALGLITLPKSSQLLTLFVLLFVLLAIVAYYQSDRAHPIQVS